MQYRVLQQPGWSANDKRWVHIWVGPSVKTHTFLRSSANALDGVLALVFRDLTRTKSRSVKRRSDCCVCPPTDAGGRLAASGIP